MAHQVLIACPTTGDLVPTGIDVESLEELNEVPQRLLISCPVCGRDHEWTPVEGVLAAD